MMRYLTILAAGLVAISMAGEAAAFCRSFGKNHSNGGGWVTSSATVDDTVYVGPEAEVCDKAQVTGNAVVVHSWVNGKAKVSGNAQIKNSNVGGFNRMSSPHVYGNAKIDGAQILHSAKIYGNAVVDGAQVRDAANVYGNAKVIPFSESFDLWSAI